MELPVHLLKKAVRRLEIHIDFLEGLVSEGDLVNKSGALVKDDDPGLVELRTLAARISAAISDEAKSMTLSDEELKHLLWALLRNYRLLEEVEEEIRFLKSAV